MRNELSNLNSSQNFWWIGYTFWDEEESNDNFMMLCFYCVCTCVCFITRPVLKAKILLVNIYSFLPFHRSEQYDSNHNYLEVV